MSSKILLVGDLITAYNIGAVATTTTLIERIKEAFPDAEIKTIDHRSFIHETPQEGWPSWTPPPPPSKGSRFRLLKKILKKAENIIHRPAPTPRLNLDQMVKSHVPNLWREMEAFSALFIQNKALSYEKRLLEWADLVIINGEGNIVNGTDNWGRYRIGARYVLTLAYLSKKILNKKTSLINFTCDPGNNCDGRKMIENILPLLDLVLPREPLSIDLLRSWKIDRIKEWKPDILFSYARDSIRPVSRSTKLRKLRIPEKNFVCIGDSSGMKSIASTVKWDVETIYRELINKVKKELNKEVVILDGFQGHHQKINNIIKQTNTPYLNLRNSDYNDIIDMLSSADIFISGRWHASIMASLSGTPFLLWGSDSHKTKSIYSIFEYKYKFFDINTLPIHIDDLINESKLILQEGNTLRNSIQRRSLELGDHSLEMISSLKSL